jgi:Leucine-rich repeat (LRR) protein
MPDTEKYNEKDILKKFYESTKGSKWLYSKNWLDDDVSVCEWHGITCESQFDMGGTSVVTGIHLPSNKLSGTVPPHIFRLQYLKVLNLRENKVDVQLSAIPENDSLEEIFLDFTEITSLDGVSKLKNIRTLHVQQNNFLGASLPPELFSLTLLENLYISDSNIGGTLSPSLAKLSNLEDFFW